MVLALHWAVDCSELRYPCPAREPIKMNSTPETWACPKCMYESGDVATQCPICEGALVHQAASWSPARRAVRVPMPPGVWGEVNGRFAVKVVDLSSLGAQLEHAEVLRPRHHCVLTLAVPGKAPPLSLPARAIWSKVHRLDPEEGVVCRSGVEFLDLCPEIRKELVEYVERVGGILPGPLVDTSL